jgi:hypothetical protein
VSFSTPVDGRPGATLTNAASGESLAFNNFAYLRYRANQIAGRGELLAFAIRDGGAGKSPSLTLNGQPAGVTAAEGQFRYKESR